MNLNKFFLFTFTRLKKINLVYKTKIKKINHFLKILWNSFLLYHDHVNYVL